MEAKEKEAPQYNEDTGVTDDRTPDTLQATNRDQNYSEDTNQPAAPKCTEESSTEGPSLSQQNTLKLADDIPPLASENRDDDQQKEPPDIKHGDVPSKTVEDDRQDGPPVPKAEESGDISAVDSVKTPETTVLDDEGNLEPETENQETLQQEPPATEQTVPGTDVETIGPTPPVDSKALSDAPPNVKDTKRRTFWIAVILVAVVAGILQQLLQPKEPLQKTDLRQIDIFHQEMNKIKIQFPGQREELWKRSRIHLQRHFQITQPTEPISIILTAGVRAELTLRCLAQSIASALSSALNASALHLDGASKSRQDSDMVKSDIDSQLQHAFEGDKPIAVIHRFEELPPASTLIFYRYCDHENAAFKKTFLIFTVLLGEEQEIQATIRLSEVEEMVTDHLQKKFLSDGHPTAFDKMDIDKYGGLWSRISHLILPVATEKRIEKTEQC